MRAVEPGDALDFDPRGSRAANARAHLVEAVGEIDHFWLARGVDDQGRATGGRRRHHRNMGAANRHLRESDLRAGQALRGLDDRVAAVNLDVRAEFLERHQKQIDRPRSDRAAARKGHPRFAHAGEQRRDDPEARAHLGHQIIGRGRVDDRPGAQMRRLAGSRLLAEAFAVDRIVNSVIAEDAGELIDVGESRQVLQGQRLIGQKGRDHQRQRGVFCAGNRDDPLQPGSAADLNAIHSLFLPALVNAPRRREFLSPRVRRHGRFFFGRRRRRRFCRAGSALRLAPPQILSEGGRKTGAPPVSFGASGVVRAHVVPSRTAVASKSAPWTRSALDRANEAQGASRNEERVGSTPVIQLFRSGSRPPPAPHG